jgi:hypothetical protein
MALLFALAFASCKKDGPIITATSGTTPGFTASTTDLQYTIADSASTGVTFNWTPSDFGVQTAINYTLQLSLDSTFTTKVSNTNYTNSTNSQTFTIDQFNSICLLIGASTGQATTVYARIQCSVAVQNSAPNSTYQYSPVIAISVDAPYALGRVILYPYLWAPGDYQGWSPGGAGCAQLYSVNSNSQYEGYIMAPAGGTYQFKLTNGASWDYNWGASDGSTLQSNIVNPNVGNMWVDTAGYWLITADTTALTWSATLQNWTIIGSMNSDGWSTDIPLTFDATNQVLVDTMNFVASDIFKFRVNGEWNTQLGSDGTNYNPITGAMGVSYNGGNISSPGTGMYIITLDLRVPSEPVCTILPE